MYRDKSKLLIALKKSIEIFDQEYKNKNFIIVFRETDGQVNCKKLIFRAKHFLHLTGIIFKDHENKDYYKDDDNRYYYLDEKGKKKFASTTNTKFRKGNKNTYYIQGVASDFYKLCLKNKLNTSRIEEKENGTTFQKLEIFPQLSTLMKSSSLVGYFNENGYELVADYFLGNTKKTAAIGFCCDTHYDIPKTLLSKDIKLLTQKPCPVISIYKKDINEPSYHLTYQSKNLVLKPEQLPDEIRELLEH